jgi:hypothetical protein
VYPLRVPPLEVDGQRSLALLEIAGAIAPHCSVLVPLREPAQRLPTAVLQQTHFFSVRLSQPRDADSRVAL